MHCIPNAFKSRKHQTAGMNFLLHTYIPRREKFPLPSPQHLISSAIDSTQVIIPDLMLLIISILTKIFQKWQNLFINVALLTNVWLHSKVLWTYLREFIFAMMDVDEWQYRQTHIYACVCLCGGWVGVQVCFLLFEWNC